MKKLVVIFFVFSFFILLADWNVGDPYKMHYPQLPDPNGWDIPTPTFHLADDFLCTESGPITDIHFWISYFSDLPQEIVFLSVVIYSDQPVDPDNEFSHPLDYLWNDVFFPNDFTIAGPWYGLQGWYNPFNNTILPENHQAYWQINIENIPDPFIQTEGTIYWLGIQILMVGGDETVGWKTSIEHWNDNAVWGNVETFWFPINDPLTGAPIDLAFVITNDSQVPVELSSFTAAYSNGTPNLFWTTQSETNNIGWNVFRAENDDMEESIQINAELIPGAGTTSQPTDYIFTDEYDVVVNQQYFYWLESIDNLGYTDTYGPISLTIPEEGEDPNTPEIPDIYGLHQNYPNPFNPNTRISFRMKEDCVGTLNVYNVKGEKVTTLFENRAMGAEEKAFVEWNGLDSKGNQVPSGIYLYELNTDAGNYSRKMVLTK